MTKDYQTIYNQRIQVFSDQVHKLKQQINWIAFLRLLEFLIASIIIYYELSNGYYAAAIWTIFVSMGLFMYLVKIHVDLKEKSDHTKYLITISQNEIKALNYEFSPFPNGIEFIDKEHPYVHDLDIFGDYSIFQFLNRAATSVGKTLLANYLKYPSQEKEIILNRQKAIQELSPKLDWRQNFQASGFHYTESQSEIDQLNNWLKEPIHIANKNFYKIALIVFPILTIISIILVNFNIISSRIVFIPVILQLGLVGLHLKKIMKHINEISKKANLIKKYAKLFAFIEQEQFNSSVLIQQQAKFQLEGKRASKQLKELANIVENIEQGGSFMGILFNGLFMWSLQYLYRLEKWQMNFQDDLNEWFTNAAQIDALASLANMYYNNQDYIFPFIQTNSFILKGENVGHPLIPQDKRIDNPIQLERLGQINLITGANMAGKSTYLRTTGINLILAMIGAPVCADSFKFSPITIFTSMRTKDSLQNSESFFYAELKRLKTIIDELNTNKNIFIILDEILKGTNSEDQHTGSKAFIEQLIKSNGVGMVATHDLSLGILADQYPGQIKNYCFEIEIIQDELKFDYKLREGLNQNLNATFLMKKMGITF